MHIHSGHLRLSPSDVTAFLACEHLTTLSLAHARGELERPELENEQAELIFRKGLEHERAYLDRLRAHGKTVLEIPDPRGDYDGAARATADAILAGVADVIYQGVLAHDNWRGVADFLLRRPDGVYEALDTKLARSSKPAYPAHGGSPLSIGRLPSEELKPVSRSRAAAPRCAPSQR